MAKHPRDTMFTGRTDAGFFDRFSHKVTKATGSHWAFLIALAIVVGWAASGPIFHFSNTWQLVINTGTTIITFLMVFLIQNTQNRDSQAVQLKLDELIRATRGAHNALLDLEELEDAELELIRRQYGQLATRARGALKQGEVDTDTPDMHA